ncbi:NAD-binding protein, partial [bacterium]|nr:NAD-binding protein [bacterium]
LWMIVGEGRMDDVSGWIGRTPYRLKRVMIAGGTAVGFHLARLLEAKGIPVKLMEPDHKRAEVWAGMLNSTVVINGKGIDLGLLREENIGDVSAFVAATDLDEDNILSAMLATKEAVPKVIAMVERSEYAHVLSSIGVHAMISKNTQAVSVILGMLRRGKILSTALLGRDAEVIEYSALETSKVTSAPLKDLDFPKGALLACIVRDDQLIIPSGETHVQVGDHILVFTMKKSVKKVEKMMTVALGYF